MTMTDVKIPFGDSPSDNAVLLLDAAENLDLDAGVIRTVAGAFLVPEEVADKAGLKADDEAGNTPQSVPNEPVADEPAKDKAPAKKAAAKKAPAKKAAPAKDKE